MSEGVCSLSQYPVCCEQGMADPCSSLEAGMCGGLPIIGSRPCPGSVCMCLWARAHIPIPQHTLRLGVFLQSTPESDTSALKA